MPLGRAVLISIGAAVLFGALSVCADGFLSLATGLDPIAEPVSPLIGPAMAALSGLIVLLSTLLGIGSPRRRPSRPWMLRGLVTGLLVFALPTAVGAVLVVLQRGDGVAGLLFFAARATGPFVPAAAIIAFVVVLLVPVALAVAERRSAPPGI